MNNYTNRAHVGRTGKQSSPNYPVTRVFRVHCMLETDYEVLEFNSFVMFLLNILLLVLQLRMKQVSAGSSVLIAYTIH